MKYLKAGLVLSATYIVCNRLFKPNTVARTRVRVPENPTIIPGKGTIIKQAPEIPDSGHGDILRAIFRYDNNKNKNLVHVRFDKITVERLNKFKLATRIDMSKFVSFAVDHLFETQPELISVIRNYIHKTPL